MISGPMVRLLSLVVFCYFGLVEASVAYLVSAIVLVVVVYHSEVSMHYQELNKFDELLVDNGLVEKLSFWDTIWSAGVNTASFVIRAAVIIAIVNYFGGDIWLVPALYAVTSMCYRINNGFKTKREFKEFQKSRVNGQESDQVAFMLHKGYKSSLMTLKRCGVSNLRYY